MNRYDTLAYQQAVAATKLYSTSFGLATKLIDKSIRQDIYNIYGIVRIADELVDTLRPKNSIILLDSLEQDTLQAMQSTVSTNPIVHAFAQTSIKYNIPKKNIESFFVSMRLDLSKKHYSKQEYLKYIYGSAEVVGLMCLKIFTGGDNKKYKQLQRGACALGAAFQKINFLRDLDFDHSNLGRVYFPDINIKKLTVADKKHIEEDIQQDLVIAKKMINKLPTSSRYGVRLAFYYYNSLFRKISQSSTSELLQSRMRVNNFHKLFLYVVCFTQKLLSI